MIQLTRRFWRSELLKPVKETQQPFCVSSDFFVLCVCYRSSQRKQFRARNDESGSSAEKMFHLVPKISLTHIYAVMHSMAWIFILHLKTQQTPHCPPRYQSLTESSPPTENMTINNEAQCKTTVLFVLFL